MGKRMQAVIASSSFILSNTEALMLSNYTYEDLELLKKMTLDSIKEKYANDKDKREYFLAYYTDLNAMDAISFYEYYLNSLIQFHGSAYKILSGEIPFEELPFIDSDKTGIINIISWRFKIGR